MNAIHISFIYLTALSLGFIGAYPTAQADQFQDQKLAKNRQCELISKAEYSTGMIFNSPGYATLYRRSYCFQHLAIEERDTSLCEEVRERKSWFFDGSGVSRTSCGMMVIERIKQDKQMGQSKDFNSIHRLVSVKFLRNGNGKDFNVVVTTVGSFAGRYELIIAISGPNLSEPVPIHKQIYSYGAPNVPRHIFLKRNQLLANLKDAFEKSLLTAYVTLRFEKTAYNRFYYDMIPEELRASRIETTVHFSELPR